MISTEWLRSGRRVKVLVGHYGSGKTELAVNMALALRKSAPVMLVDLDIVNPFFRSAEVKPLLAEHGVEIVYPAYALSGVDIPILPAEVERAFTTDGFSVFDVGGDDDGAVALGRYHVQFAACPAEDLCPLGTERFCTPVRVPFGMAQKEPKGHLGASP